MFTKLFDRRPIIVAGPIDINFGDREGGLQIRISPGSIFYQVIPFIGWYRYDELSGQEYRVFINHKEIYCMTGEMIQAYNQLHQ